MSASRHISPDLYTDDWFGTLNMTDRMLWIGILTTIADDQGRFVNNPAIIRVKIFPYDEQIKTADISNAIDTFIKSRRLISYSFGLNGSKKDCLQIFNWWRYQKAAAWMGRSEYPAPQGWMDRIRCHAAGNQIFTENWDKPGGLLDSDYLPTTKELPSRESEVKVEVKVESEDESESEVESTAKKTTDDDRIQTLTKIFKLAGIPQNYRNRILSLPSITAEDLLAELSRNYARKGSAKGQVKQPGLITGMNLAKAERPAAEWYERSAWTRHLPAGMLSKLGLVNSEDTQEIEDAGCSDYANSQEEPDNAWEKVKVQLNTGMPKSNYDRWVRDTKLHEISNNVVLVLCPNQGAVDWLTDRVLHTAQNLLTGICNQKIKLTFITNS